MVVAGATPVSRGLAPPPVDGSHGPCNGKVVNDQGNGLGSCWLVGCFAPSVVGFHGPWNGKAASGLVSGQGGCWFSWAVDCGGCL